MEKWQYYGLFLTKDSRIKLLDFLRSDKCSTQVTLAVHYNSQDNRVYLDHCTLLHIAQYDNSFTDNLIKGRLDLALEDNRVKANLNITHIGISDKAMAFKVSLQDSEFDMCSLTLLCANKIPHITICTFNGGKPVDSNNITKWYDLNEPISIETILKKV